MVFDAQTENQLNKLSQRTTKPSPFKFDKKVVPLIAPSQEHHTELGEKHI
jgi:hypothetical protein